MLSIRNQLRVTTSKSGVQEITAGTQRRPRKAAVISETANMYAHGSGPANNSMNVSVLPQGGLLYDTMLSGLLGENEQQNMRFYRDIYYYDTVAGACVDLMSTMPFSPFTITECETSERTGVYRASVAALNLEGLLPEMTMDRLVTGQFIGTPIYKASAKKFVDLIPWKAEQCDVQATPFLGIDPLITAKPSPELERFLHDQNDYFVRMRESLNPQILETLSSSSVELDPLTTIFLPRKTFTNNYTGTSFFKRILPLYLIEKSLYRGTLIEAGRRQRSFLHAAIGDDIWEPTPQEMQATVALIQQADLDPLGAIVGTRGAVQLSEHRCLAEDTSVETRDGYADISVFGPTPKDGKPYTMPLAIQVRGYDGAWKDTKEWHYQGKQPIFGWTFGEHVIKCTERHEMLVLNPGGDVGLAPIGKLDGRYVCRESTTDAGVPRTVFADLLHDRFVLASKGTDREVFVSDTGEHVIVPAGWTAQFSDCFDSKGMLQYSRWEEHAAELDIIKQISPLVYSNIEYLVEKKFSFARLTSKEYLGVQDAYDLTMADGTKPLFMANGFVTKNSGGDFWKYTDITEVTTSMKLRALGISESFLSGEATYASMEVSLSVFVENLRAFRDAITSAVFYKKLFPLIAYANGYFKSGVDTKGEAGSGISLKHNLNDATMLDMPTIQYQKALRPEADQAYLDVLGTLKDHDVPIGIATWAAAGGMTTDQLIKEAQADVELRKKLAEITGTSPGGDNDQEFASIRNALTPITKRGRHSILARDWGDMEYSDVTPTGKRQYVYRQKARKDKEYDQLAKAAKALHENGTHGRVLSNVISRLGKIPGIF